MRGIRAAYGSDRKSSQERNGAEFVHKALRKLPELQDSLLIRKTKYRRERGWKGIQTKQFPFKIHAFYTSAMISSRRPNEPGSNKFGSNVISGQDANLIDQ